MVHPDEFTVATCLSEVKVALEALEVAMKASMAASATRLREAHRQVDDEASQVSKAAKDEAAHHARRAAEAEARNDVLEEKLQGKRAEIAELWDLVTKMERKLERKSEQLQLLESKLDKRRRNVTTEWLAISNDDRRESAYADKGGKLLDKAGEKEKGRGSRGIKEETRQPATATRQTMTSEEEDNRRRSLSEDSSETAEEKERQTQGQIKIHPREWASCSPESRCDRKPHGDQMRSHSRGRSSECPDCKRELSRERSCSADTRCRGSGSPARRGHQGSKAREERHRYGTSRSRSRNRSRSRGQVPRHTAAKGRGKGKGQPPLCIPFVAGRCIWGAQCRDRHPDPEGAQKARESLMSRTCRFGLECFRKDCIFKHPEGRRRCDG